MSIVDEGDWESEISRCRGERLTGPGAVDEAREAAKGRAEGKLEIYLT